ncbi:hypothetical protein, variant [Blastomyces gilchristii SLH14081]|uniref:Uncharacterized protein n=1 Tax=Blastomyces gilchristii (strain SLH14081) TaxID=559298 RepID=A0A179UAV4_BLAGS|nr:uncharacterized protein BDBG_00759 [Blastomyces gilchristii SLH14081]XP_031576012.1 hypothetical protein, variant [Blastomyces gilchristii SLH14081]OAT04140.1 hypothetical protein BDBG_00759 [Blastomyces gilchristii SLH14081]OAT04141.1 hypothetical protein, variant [Blastomyces gilchristii SLH14081]
MGAKFLLACKTIIRVRTNMDEQPVFKQGNERAVINTSFPVPSTQPDTPGCTLHTPDLFRGIPYCNGIDSLGDGHPCTLACTAQLWRGETEKSRSVGNAVKVKATITQCQVVVLDSPLKTKLSELGDIVCDLGEKDIGKFLKTICDSPDDTTSFFKAVTTAIRRQNTRKPTRHEFFQSFTLKKQALSDEQVSSLATITKNWELDDNKLEELEKSAQIEDVSPVRRVVNSIKVFESIEEEVRAQCSEYKKNHQESLEPQEPTKILSRVLNSATEKICCQLPKEKIKEQRSRLYKQYSRGKKWAQIKPGCMVLSLQSTSVRRFEWRKWASIKISALNAYIEHLHAFSMRDSLSMAYMRIHEEYVRRSSPQNRSTNSSQAIDGWSGKQKLPPGKKRRTQASRAHVGPSPVFEPSTSTITGFNDHPAQQTSANHLGTSNQIENRRSTSSTYSCPSGSGAPYDPAYYSMQSEPTLAGALIQQFPQGYGESVNPSVEGDVYPNPGYGESVNPSVERDVYSNPGYGESVNPSVEGDVYPNPGYGESVNPSVEGDVYPNPGYRQSVNPSVEGDVYPNPGYGEYVNPSVKGDVYPIIFF